MQSKRLEFKRKVVSNLSDLELKNAKGGTNGTGYTQYVTYCDASTCTTGGGQLSCDCPNSTYPFC